jgi:transposase
MVVNQERRRAMQEYIALDVHKHYTLAEREPVAGGRAQQCRIEHQHGCLARYLEGTEPGTTVALEATGNWYWLVAEIEQAGCVPALVHPRKAKLMLGSINKTDKLDVHGLNRLQRVGTLPRVWIAPAATRDLRELPRTRMFLAQQRTRLKNRIHAKYGLGVRECSDAFGTGGRRQIDEQLRQLPPQCRLATAELLRQLDLVQEQMAEQERRIEELVALSPAMQRLMSLPGVGRILAVVLALEIGEVSRFASADRLASYAGTTPRVHASGQTLRYGRLRSDVNRYLKWAYVEAANCVQLHRRHFPHRHVTQLYERLARRKGHPKAIGAVARHLAEASFHVLSRQEDYREPSLNRRSETRATQARSAHGPVRSGE